MKNYGANPQADLKFLIKVLLEAKLPQLFTIHYSSAKRLHYSFNYYVFGG